MQLFDRKCVVLIGREPAAGSYALELPNALRIEGLRTSFKVSRDRKPEPNTLELAIFNLSPATRGVLQGRGFRVVLQAGYAEQVAQVFSGDVVRFTHEQNGPDMVTKIVAADGARAIRNARVSESYRAGTPVSEVIARTVRALQLDPGNAAAKAAAIADQYAAGYTQHAPAAEELTRLLEPRGYTWSIQDGRLELLGPGESLPELAPLISADTGMIGSPELGSPAEKGKPATLKVRSLLQPAIRPGQRFQLESKAHRGTFTAQKVTHAGDTHAGDWFTDLEANQ